MHGQVLWAKAIDLPAIPTAASIPAATCSCAHAPLRGSSQFRIVNNDNNQPNTYQSWHSALTLK